MGENEQIPIPQEQTSAYLLRARGGYLQVDTGYEQDYGTYRKVLEARGIAPDEVRWLLLTHHHDDHAGYLNALTADNPKVRIVAHARAETLLAQGENDKSRGGGLLNRRIYILFRLKRWMEPGWDLTFPPFRLRDGDLRVKEPKSPMLEGIGIGGPILYTPGHTSDSISLLRNDGALFCVDLASNVLAWAGAHHATLFNESMAAVYESWRRVLALGARRIYPAHGAPFDASVLREEMGHHRDADLIPFF